MKYSRRELLALIGPTAAASMTTTGCLGNSIENASDPVADGNSTDEKQLPSYASWLHTDKDSNVVFSYMDWASIEQFDGSELKLGENKSKSASAREDPMIAYPMAAVFITGIGSGFGLWGTGLEKITQPSVGRQNNSDSSTVFKTDITEYLWVNNAFVLIGEIDTEEIDAELTTVPNETYTMETAYEQTGKISGYATYEPATDDSEGSTDSMGASVIAVGKDAIVFAGNNTDGVGPVEAIRHPIEAHAGDSNTASDDEAEFEWLLETAGHGQIAIGSYADDVNAIDNTSIDEGSTGANSSDDGSTADESTPGALEKATKIVNSLTFESESKASGDLAATFDKLTDKRKSKLKKSLGSSATEATVEVDDNRVTASATWEKDVTDSA